MEILLGENMLEELRTAMIMEPGWALELEEKDNGLRLARLSRKTNPSKE